MKYRERVVVVEAVQWDGESYDAFPRPDYTPGAERRSLWVNTMDGPHLARRHDWIVTDVFGVRSVWTPDAFEMIYEPVEA